MTDRVLLDENGCYNDDLVDVLFSETARKYGTQTAQLSLAYKLSALDNKGENHPHKPETLVSYGSRLDFATPSGLISFPISITTHAGDGDGIPRAPNDDHYSVAVYSVSINKIFHADSLSYPAHTQFSSQSGLFTARVSEAYRLTSQSTSRCRALHRGQRCTVARHRF